MDHMGSSEFLTSDVTQRITSWTSYDEWGNITHNAVLKCGTRELDLVKNYTGHERDSVLRMYYAKARMYDTADKHGSTKGNKLGDKRFMAVDPVKGNVRNPQSMVQYTYVLNNPLLYVDPLGMNYHLTWMKAGGGGTYSTTLLDESIITVGDKRYIKVRRMADLVDAANGISHIPNIDFQVNLRDNTVVDIQYRTAEKVSGAMSLNLNHIGYNTLVQGVYFRYEQCGYTYVDLMGMSNKMGVATYLYSDAEYQAYVDSVFEFYTGLDQKGYMVASASQIALGNYSENDITVLGTIGQIASGVIGADLPADLRDLAYDLQHWNELVKNNPGQIALDAIGVLPVIGVLKNADEVALVVKNADGTIEKVIKNSDTLYDSGLRALQKANIDNFTIKNKHLNTSGGGWEKFNVGTEAEAHKIAKEVVAKNKIVSITNNDNLLGSEGQKSYLITFDAERVIGSKGETKLRVAIDELGNIWTIFPASK
ncbi:MAG: RHS repeat-associated core domain-containing protein [Peptococcaceae bacterium]